MQPNGFNKALALVWPGIGGWGVCACPSLAAGGGLLVSGSEGNSC